VPGRIYAIGDVHGAARLLDRLLGRIEAECRADGVTAELVLMGDYVDRGDSSRDVLDLIASLGERPGLAPVLLRGNHEEMLLDVVDGRTPAARWLRYGGLQTLLSYEVGGLAALGGGGAAEDDLRDALADAMGPHLDLLRRLGSSHWRGNVFFAHAGADPDLPLGAQPQSALIWGAAGFLERPRGDGNWVVHGHYVVDAPNATEGRVAIDTGAYFSQRLSAVRIDGTKLDFLTETLDD
jgi:serine/threonine protein phosphatase 1